MSEMSKTIKSNSQCEIRLNPLGYVRCDAKTVDAVPSEGLPALLHINPEFASAIGGLESGMFIYVITYLHEADSTTMLASPGTPYERGAFNIRSSCRPNCIGMTLTRITNVSPPLIAVEWLDFSDGTPILDIKRYNWRWECIFSAPRDNRKHIEVQIERMALAEVLARPAAYFHGEACAWVKRVSEIAAELVQEYDIFLSDPKLTIHIEGNGHIIDAIQGITGASFGNGRLTVEYAPESQNCSLIIQRGNNQYKAEITEQGYAIMYYPAEVDR